MAASASNSAVQTRVDPLRPVRISGWRPVEFALLAMLLCSFALIPWMWAAYLPATSGDSHVSPGMTKAEVLVVLGEPNERLAEDVCWNYDRYQDGKDRTCVRFNALGQVVTVSRNASN
jgi:hypothetical protein